MLLCARDAGNQMPVTGLAVSQDLKTWEQVAPLTSGTQFPPECPDVFQIGKTWYMLYSPSQGFTHYRHAQSSSGPWIDPAVPEIDTQFLYAAKRMFHGKRQAVTGWVRDLEGSRDGGGHRWGGDQSVPRELYAAPDGRLLQRVVPEATQVFSKTVFNLSSKPPVTGDGWTYQGNALTSTTGARTTFDSPDNYLLEGRFKMGAQSSLTLAFRAQDDETAGYHLTIRAVTGEIELSGRGFDYKRVCQIDFSQLVHVQAFVQGSIIECFINDAYAFSCRAYNFRQGKLGLSASGGDVQVLELALKTPSTPDARLVASAATPDEG